VADQNGKPVGVRLGGHWVILLSEIEASDWAEIWHAVLDSRAQAAALERRIKCRGARRFLADLANEA
jgi:hypothetical protein